MRNMFALIFVTSGLAAVTYSLRVEDVLPNLHRCNCESYEEDCLIKAIESMKPYLATGVKKLNIPTFMPYKLGMLTFEPYSPEKGNYKILLQDRNSSLLLINIQLGLGDFYISKLKVTSYLPNMEIVIHYRKITLDADAFRNGPTLTSPLDESARKYYERIRRDFINTTIYAKIGGYKSPSFASGNLQHFYLSNIHMTWNITEVEDHINYFKLDKYTSALSMRTVNKTENERSLDLPYRTVRDEVLDDLSYYIRKDLKTMLDKMTLQMLCIY